MVNLVALLIYNTIDKFSNDGVNFSLVPHLEHALNLESLIRFWPVTIIFFLALVAIVVPTAILHFWFERNPVLTSSATMRFFFLPICLISAVALNPLTSESLILYKTTKNLANIALPESFNSINVVAPPITYSSPPKLGSFVIILAESFESSFLNDEIYSNLTPKLNKLITDKGFRINGIGDLQLSNWTDTALVAILCGTSMSVDRTPNSSHSTDSVFPQVGETCVGDILSKDGYSLYFYGASDFSYDNKYDLLSPQGFEVSMGENISPSQPANANVSAWGMHDDEFFAKVLIKIKSKTNTLPTPPVGHVLLTVDTHVPGYYSRNCNFNESQEHMNDYLKAVKCADDNISFAINHLLKNHEGLTVFLMSDHIAPGRLPETEVREVERDNLFVVFNSRAKNAESGKEVNRTASSLDIGPTILANLGYEINTLNLGRNLLGTKPTLPEQMGYPIFANNIVKLRKIVRKHWKDKQLDKKISSLKP